MTTPMPWTSRSRVICHCSASMRPLAAVSQRLCREPASRRRLMRTAAPPASTCMATVVLPLPGNPTMTRRPAPSGTPCASSTSTWWQTSQGTRAPLRQTWAHRAQLGTPLLHPVAFRADTASVAAMTPKDRRVLQVGSLIAIAAVFMALGGGLFGTHRPLGLALLVLGIVMLQAAWIPAIPKTQPKK